MLSEGLGAPQIPYRLLVLFFLISSGASAAAEGSPLNVVILDVCSARADHFGLYGYAKKTTPEIDALAKESIVFDRAMAQSSWCLPNYASLFTGHVPEVHGQYANTPFRPLPKFEKTLAERMKKAGYRTAAFSGGIYLLRAWGLDRGFDEYANLFSSAPALPASFSVFSSEAVDWIRRNKERPFFVYAAVDDLHVPYQSKDSERYDPGYDGVVHDTETLNVRFFRAYNGEPLDPADPLRTKLGLFRKDPRSLEHVAAHYDAALHGVDKEVSEFVRRLKEMGLWDHTVFILTSDHGELLGEHGLLGHTESLYEPVLHVPLLMHHPGFSGLQGRRLQDLVERIDITPTVLDIAGASYQDGELQGKSLVPLLRDSSRPLRDFAFASSKRNMSTVADFNLDERVIRDKRWKLHWYSYKDHFELYDLERDPLETKDVAPDHPDLVQRLAFELLRHVELTRPHVPGLPSGKDRQIPPELESKPRLR